MRSPLPTSRTPPNPPPYTHVHTRAHTRTHSRAHTHTHTHTHTPPSPVYWTPHCRLHSLPSYPPPAPSPLPLPFPSRMCPGDVDVVPGGSHGAWLSLLSSTTCPPGRWGLSGQSPCSPCPAGTLGLVWGLGAESANGCSGPCPPGTYSEAGAAACTPCPPGRWGNRPGLPSPACWGPCAPGFACPQGSRSPAPADAACPVGRFSPGGVGACTVCPAGVYGAEVALPSASCSGLCAYVAHACSMLHPAALLHPPPHPAPAAHLLLCTHVSLLPRSPPAPPPPPPHTHTLTHPPLPPAVPDTHTLLHDLTTHHFTSFVTGQGWVRVRRGQYQLHRCHLSRRAVQPARGWRVHPVPRGHVLRHPRLPHALLWWAVCRGLLLRPRCRGSHDRHLPRGAVQPARGWRVHPLPRGHVRVVDRPSHTRLLRTLPSWVGDLIKGELVCVGVRGSLEWRRVRVVCP